MQQQKNKRLDAIRREATLLEFDLHITPDQCLELKKRGDASLFYRSTRDHDDERALQETWQWLQRYKTNVQRIDEICTQLTNRQMPHSFHPGRTLVLVLPAFVLGSSISLLTGTLWLGIVTYGVLSGATFLLQCLFTRPEHHVADPPM